MIAPLSGLELQLLQILVDRRHDAGTLTRLRNILVALHAADQLSDALVEDLMARLSERYQDSPELSAMHQETCALLEAGGRVRAKTRSAG